MYYLRLIYALVTHLDFLYFCFVDQDSAHDRNPIRRLNNPRRNLRVNGRGRGRGRGRGLVGVGILQLRGPEITLCQQTDHLLNHRLVQHIDILDTVGREHFFIQCLLMICGS